MFSTPDTLDIFVFPKISMGPHYYNYSVARFLPNIIQPNQIDFQFAVRVDYWALSNSEKKPTVMELQTDI